MSQAVPVVALAALVALSLFAKVRRYEMSSSGLMVLTVVLTLWLVALFWRFG